jgi:hypothetical protein
MSNTVKFIEVYNRSGGGTIRDYSLRTIYINPNHVISLVEDDRTSQLLHEGSLPQDLDPRQQFTNISLNVGVSGQSVVVVGSIQEIHHKLYENSKTLLKG